MRRIVSKLVIPTSTGSSRLLLGTAAAATSAGRRSFITATTKKPHSNVSCSTSRLLPTSSTFSLQQKSSFSSESPKSQLTDKELQASFQGIWPRVSAMMELLDDSGREQYDKLMKGNVISSDKHLIGINLYADLQNPLFKKYQFDAIDFMKGAKEAFLQLRRAVTSMEIKDSIHTAHSEELLKEAFNPPLFKLYMAAFRAMESRDYKISLQDIQIKDVVIGAASTIIVDEEFYKEEEYTYNRLAELLSKFTLDPPSNNEEDASKMNFDNAIERRYDIGSVVANIDVMYDTEEVYLKIDANQQEETIHRNIRSVVRFQSCISGHKEWDWVVTMMDGTEMK